MIIHQNQAAAKIKSEIDGRFTKSEVIEAENPEGCAYVDVQGQLHDIDLLSIMKTTLTWNVHFDMKALITRSVIRISLWSNQKA